MVTVGGSVVLNVNTTGEHDSRDGMGRDVRYVSRGGDRHRRRNGVERDHDRRAGADVADGVGVLGNDAVGTVALQCHLCGPGSVAGNGRSADLLGHTVDGVEQRDGGTRCGETRSYRSGNRLRCRISYDDTWIGNRY